MALNKEVKMEIEKRECGSADKNYQKKETGRITCAQRDGNLEFQYGRHPPVSLSLSAQPPRTLRNLMDEILALWFKSGPKPSLLFDEDDPPDIYWSKPLSELTQLFADSRFAIQIGEDKLAIVGKYSTREQKVEKATVEMPLTVEDLVERTLPSYQPNSLHQFIAQRDYGKLLATITARLLPKDTKQLHFEQIICDGLLKKYIQPTEGSTIRFLLFGQRRSGKSTTLCIYLNRMATYFQEHKVFIFVYDWSALPQQAVWTDIVSQFLLSLRDAFQGQLPLGTDLTQLFVKLRSYLLVPELSDEGLIRRLVSLPSTLARAFGFSSTLHCYDEFERTFPTLLRGSEQMRIPINYVLKETIGPRGNDHFILTGTDCIQLAYATGNENVTLTNYSSLLTKGFEDDIVHLREVVTLAQYNNEFEDFVPVEWGAEELTFDDFAGVPGYLCILQKTKNVGTLMITIQDGIVQDFDNLKRIAMFKKIDTAIALDESNPLLVMDLLKIMTGETNLSLLSRQLMVLSGFIPADGKPYVRVAALAYQMALQKQLKREIPEHLRTLLQIETRPHILGWYFQDAVEATIAQVEHNSFDLVSTTSLGKDTTTIHIEKLERMDQALLESPNFEPKLGHFYFDHGEPPEDTKDSAVRHLVGIDGIYGCWVNRNFQYGSIVALQIKLLLCLSSATISETLAKFLGKRKKKPSQLMAFAKKAYQADCSSLSLNIEYVSLDDHNVILTHVEDAVEQLQAMFGNMKRLVRIYLTEDPKWKIDVKLFFVATGDLTKEIQVKFAALHFISGKYLTQLIPDYLPALQLNPTFLLRQIVSDPDTVDNPVKLEIYDDEKKEKDAYFPSGKIQLSLLETFAVRALKGSSESEFQFEINDVVPQKKPITQGPVILSLKRRAPEQKQSFKIRIIGDPNNPNSFVQAVRV